jgi:hypothetical protein
MARVADDLELAIAVDVLDLADEVAEGRVGAAVAVADGRVAAAPGDLHDNRVQRVRVLVVRDTPPSQLLVGGAGADADQDIVPDARLAGHHLDSLELVTLEEPLRQKLGEGGEVGNLGGFQPD